MLMTLQCHFVSEYNIDNFLGSSINETYPLGRARGFVQKSYGRNRQECVKVHGRIMEYKLYECQRHGWKNEGTIKVVPERGEVLATPSRVK